MERIPWGLRLLRWYKAIWGQLFLCTFVLIRQTSATFLTAISPPCFLQFSITFVFSKKNTQVIVCHQPARPGFTVKWDGDMTISHYVSFVCHQVSRIMQNQQLMASTETGGTTTTTTTTASYMTHDDPNVRSSSKGSHRPISMFEPRDPQRQQQLQKVSILQGWFVTLDRWFWNMDIDQWTPSIAFIWRM